MNSIFPLSNSVFVYLKESFNLDSCEKCSDKVKKVAFGILFLFIYPFAFSSALCVDLFEGVSVAWELFRKCFPLSISIESMRTKMAGCQEQIQKIQRPIENVDYNFMENLASLKDGVDEVASLVSSIKPRRAPEELANISEEVSALKEAVSSLLQEVYGKLKHDESTLLESEWAKAGALFEKAETEVKKIEDLFNGIIVPFPDLVAMKTNLTKRQEALVKYQAEYKKAKDRFEVEFGIISDEFKKGENFKRLVELGEVIIKAGSDANQSYLLAKCVGSRLTNLRNNVINAKAAAEYKAGKG